MPLPPNTKVTEHFTAYELGADKPEATDVIIANLRRVALWLEVARTVVRREIGAVSEADSRGKFKMGRRSGFRTVAENRTVKGSATSDHLTGESGDWVPIGVTLWRVYHILKDAAARGELPPFDQLIYYAYDGHVHVGLGSRMRGEVRIQLREGGDYLLVTNELVNKLPGAIVTGIAIAGSVTQAAVGFSLSALVNLALVVIVLLYLGSVAI
jgi:hypothetical protein